MGVVTGAGAGAPVGALAVAAAVPAGAVVLPCVVALADTVPPGAFADLASALGVATEPPTPTEAAADGVFTDAPLVLVPCAEATDTHKSDASIARAAFRSLITEPSRQ